MSQYKNLDPGQFQVLPINGEAFFISELGDIKRALGYVIFYDHEETLEMSTHIIDNDGFYEDRDNNNGNGYYPYFGRIPFDKVKRGFSKRLKDDGISYKEYIEEAEACGYHLTDEEKESLKKMSKGRPTDSDIICVENIEKSGEWVEISDGDKTAWQHKEKGYTIDLEDNGWLFLISVDTPEGSCYMRATVTKFSEIALLEKVTFED